MISAYFAKFFLFFFGLPLLLILGFLIKDWLRGVKKPTGSLQPARETVPSASQGRTSGTSHAA